MVLVVHSSLPAKSVARADRIRQVAPGELTSLARQRLAFGPFARSCSIPWPASDDHVLQGVRGALADVLAGRVPVYYMNLVLALPLPEGREAARAGRDDRERSRSRRSCLR